MVCAPGLNPSPPRVAVSAHIERVRSALAAHYAVKRELGAGGMGTVYLAEDLKRHRKVAIKVLKPELAKHVTEPARPVTEHRGSVPPALAEEILKKLPVRRGYWQGSYSRIFVINPEVHRMPAYVEQLRRMGLK